MSNRFVFVGGALGKWRVTLMSGVRGPGLEPVERLGIFNAEAPSGVTGANWMLRGLVSNVRYATRAEVSTLKSRQPGLNRPEAVCAALIPIRKSARWWELAQDERREIFEESSRHTAIGLEYLPAIARRLHHCRDIGEPFDFLTWFEYAPEHRDRFEQLVARLRGTKEWEFVDREVDVRLERAAS